MAVEIWSMKSSGYVISESSDAPVTDRNRKRRALPIFVRAKPRPV